MQTEKFFDALGSASFLTLTAGSLLLSGPITPRKVWENNGLASWGERGWGEVRGSPLVLTAAVSFWARCPTQGLDPPHPLQVLVSCMAGLWAVRLGSYLVHRIHKAGKDSRFDEVKHQPLNFLVYWLLQAIKSGRAGRRSG